MTSFLSDDVWEKLIAIHLHYYQTLKVYGETMPSSWIIYIFFFFYFAVVNSMYMYMYTKTPCDPITHVYTRKMYRHFVYKDR